MNIQTIERGGIKFSFINKEEFERIYDDIFKRNEYPFTTDKPTPFILDCGSHIGLSILYFKNKYPNARITAFEPNPRTFNLLQKNIEQNNLRDVKLINAAVSDRKGKIEFFVDKKIENPWGWGDSAVINKWYSSKTAKSIKVDTARLSKFLKSSVDLLKLDIEGMEERVLQEIKSKLSKVKEIMMEYHGSSTNPRNDLARILSFLRTNGFNYKIKQEGKFIKESQIKKLDPYWLTIHAENKVNA